MNTYLLSLILLLLGIYSLVKSITYFKDEEKLKSYIENHPKSYLLRKKYGVEKSCEISKKFLLPISFIISSIFIIISLIILFLS